MNERVKSKWTEALRSGEYKQTTGYLRNEDSFCVLGVLCDLHAKETGNRWTPNSYLNSRGEDERLDHYMGCSAQLPSAVRDWAELSAIDPVVCFEGEDAIAYWGNCADKYDRKTYLSVLNDMGYSFSQTADLIDKYL